MAGESPLFLLCVVRGRADVPVARVRPMPMENMDKNRMRCATSMEGGRSGQDEAILVSRRRHRISRGVSGCESAAHSDALSGRDLRA